MSMYTTAQLLAANEQKLSLIRCFCVSFSVRAIPSPRESLSLTNSGTGKHGAVRFAVVSGEVIRSRGGSTSEFTPGMSNPST